LALSDLAQLGAREAAAGLPESASQWLYKSALLDGLTGQRLFQPKTQIKSSIFKMAEVSKNSVTQSADYRE
jgi:hypothetical protein